MFLNVLPDCKVFVATSEGSDDVCEQHRPLPSTNLETYCLNLLYFFSQLLEKVIWETKVREHLGIYGGDPSQRFLVLVQHDVWVDSYCSAPT